MKPCTTDKAAFDEYAADYDTALNMGISVSGENKSYFAHGRVDWLARCLRAIGEHPRTAVDFGCGMGTTIRYLLDLLAVDAVVGVDASPKSLEIARKSCDSSRVRLTELADYCPEGHLDLAFCNGVFHHISPPERPAAVKLIHDSLRRDGLFSFWENNPWNPGTKYVMKRIPFDKDAITLSAPEACRLLSSCGFQVLRVDFLFVFPSLLSCFRRFEPRICKFPFGAQYQVLCRR